MDSALQQKLDAARHHILQADNYTSSPFGGNLLKVDPLAHETLREVTETLKVLLDIVSDLAGQRPTK